MSEVNTNTLEVTPTAEELAAAQAAADAAKAAEVKPEEIPEWFPTKYVKDGKMSVEDLAKSYKNLEAKLGTRAPGAPATAAEYQLKPTDWPADQPWNEEAATKLAETFHGAGLSAEQATKLAASIIELERESQKTIAEGSTKLIDDAVVKLEADRITEHNKKVTEGMDNLRKEWGHTFDARISDLKQIAHNMGLDTKDPELFGSAAVIKMLGKFASLMGEESASVLRGGSIRSTNFADGPAEAAAIMGDANHPDHKAYRSGDRKVIARVNALLAQR